MRDSIRHFLAELLGTFALVFIGGLAIINAEMRQSSTALLEAALAHGLILAVMVSAVMRVAGHFNPAVTLGFLAARRIEPIMAGVYIIAQFLGASLASYALLGCLPDNIALAARLGGQAISLDVSAAQAITMEAIATFFLVFVIFGTAVDEQSPNVGGFAIGLTLAASILAIGPLTGGSLNPARSLGPAVVSGVYEAQLIYWLAPIVGGALAGLLYHWLFLRRGLEPVDHGAVAPRP